MRVYFRYFRPCRPQIGVRVSLREESTYWRLKIVLLRREIAGLQFGVHVRKVSISEGLTVCLKVAEHSFGSF